MYSKCYEIWHSEQVKFVNLKIRDLDPKLGRLGLRIAMRSNFYEIWNLVQIEHANYEYGTWKWWSWPKIICSGKFCRNTEICSDFHEIWHLQQMKHANTSI